MSQEQLVLGLTMAVALGIVSMIAMLRRQRRERTEPVSPFAVSTEGDKRCPHCGMGNLWTEATCSVCGGRLPG